MEDRQFEPLPTEPPVEESTPSLRTRRLLDTFPSTHAASVTESHQSQGVGGPEHDAAHIGGAWNVRG
jgi:hypothetical protein